MKTNRIIFALCPFLLLVSACSYDTLPTYEDIDRVYFEWAKYETQLSELSARSRESVTVGFGYDNPVKSDSIVRIKVCMTGHISENDRPISAALVKNESTAVDGDIEFLPSYIPAGKVEGELLVNLKNSAKLTTNMFQARIRLTPNEYFHVDYTAAMGYSGKNGTEYTIFFDAQVEMPSLWANADTKRYYDAYFGTYSKVKLQLICDVCGLTREFFMHDPATENAVEVMNARISGAVAMGLVSMVNRYLNQYRVEHGGESLRDENGNEIRMGAGIM